MTRWTGEIREVLTQNIGYKLVALAFALAFWAWVQSEQTVEERVRAQLTWTLPEGLALAEAPLEATTLTVQGVQTYVRGLRSGELTIAIDLSRATEGDATVDLAERAVIGLPPQVRVAEIMPATLRVSLERILKRKVPVMALSRGEVASGYRLVSLIVEPSRVELVGPAGALRSLESVPVDEVDISGIKTDTDFDVALVVKKGQISPSHPTTFVVKARVEPTLQTRTLDAVPVFVRDPRFVATTTTVKVVLEGPAEQVDGIDPDAVSVMVSVPEGFAGTSGDARWGKGEGPRFEVQTGGGEGVRVVSVEPDHIELGAR